MTGLDTNVLVRLPAQDDAALAAAARRLLAPLDQTPESVLVNDIVLVETVWTLKRAYGLGREELVTGLEHLLSALTFRFEDRDSVSKATRLFSESAADFSDCLIAVRKARLGCSATATFDQAMGTLEGVSLLKS